jgi:uncharacterized protein (DUF1800 family)
MRTRPWWALLAILAVGAPLLHAAGAVPMPAADAARLLTRVTYGVAPGDMDALRRLGREAWIEAALHPVADPDLDGRLAFFDTLGLSPEDLREQYPFPSRKAKVDPMMRAERREAKETQRTPLRERAQARLLRAVYGREQVTERIAAFWLDHFNVYPRKSPAMAWLLGSFEDDVRAHLFGSFRELLGVVAHSPAMLLYLDNARSAVADGEGKHPGLNENYARELLELHTVGIDGGYSQADVGEVARVLTGWGIVIEPRDGLEAGTFRFRTRWHDWGPKEVLGTRFGPDGEAEGEALLDMLARDPATVHHVATRLCRAFVGDPTLAMVDRVVQRWTATDGDLPQVYRALLEDPDLLAGAPARSPLQWMAAALRAGAVQDIPAEDLVAELDDMGQSVLGSLAPNGYGDTDWLSTDALLQRMTVAPRIAAAVEPSLREAGVSSPSEMVARFLPTHTDDTALVERLGASGDPAGIVARVLASPEFQRR